MVWKKKKEKKNKILYYTTTKIIAILVVKNNGYMEITKIARISSRDIKPIIDKVYQDEESKNRRWTIINNFMNNS